MTDVRQCCSILSSCLKKLRLDRMLGNEISNQHRNGEEGKGMEWCWEDWCVHAYDIQPFWAWCVRFWFVYYPFVAIGLRLRFQDDPFSWLWEWCYKRNIFMKVMEKLNWLDFIFRSRWIKVEDNFIVSNKFVSRYYNKKLIWNHGVYKMDLIQSSSCL